MEAVSQPNRPSSTHDFLTTRPEAMDVCHGLASGSANLDEVLRAITSAIGDNVTVLAVATCVVAASLAVVWYVGSSIYSAMAEWRKHQLPGRPEQPGSQNSGANADRNDDVTYALSAGDDGIPSDLGPAPTAPIVAARMAKLAKRYGTYNAAMRQHAAEHGYVADDIMDARIIGRGNDDWAYPRRKAGGGAGASRPWALRSPVYNMNPA